MRHEDLCRILLERIGEPGYAVHVAGGNETFWPCVVVLIVPAAIFAIVVAVVWGLLMMGRREGSRSVPTSYVSLDRGPGRGDGGVGISPGTGKRVAGGADREAMDSIFSMPPELELVARFEFPRVKAGVGTEDSVSKREVLERSGLDGHTPDGGPYVFVIRAYLGRGRAKTPRQIPDVDNIAKLIVDAFTGVLYEDDQCRYVRGVQVESHWVEDHEERTEVWICSLREAGPS